MDKWILENQTKLTHLHHEFEKMTVLVCGLQWQVRFYPHYVIELRRKVCGKEVLVKVFRVIGNNEIIAVFTHQFTPDEEYFISPVLNIYRKNVQFIFEFYSSQRTSPLIKIETKKEVDSKIFSDDLGCNFYRLLKEGQFADVTIRCDTEVFRAHRVILSARSPFFAAMFQNPMKESQGEEVDLKDINPEVFNEILTYIYSGKSQPESHSVEITCKILEAADRYILPGLKTSCADALRSAVLETNALDILTFADLHDQELKKDILSYVCQNYDVLKSSPRWKSLEAENPSLIISILTDKIERLK